MVMSEYEKKIADAFIRTKIESHIKKKYLKKGIVPTTEQVIQDIDKNALETLLSQSYTEDEIKSMAEDVIRRQKIRR